jgi:hypothetical protein
VRTARYLAQQDLHSSASRVGAEGVVGVEIRQHQREYEVEMQNGVKRTDIIFSFLTIGTAVARLKEPRPLNVPKLVMPLSGRGQSRIRPANEFEGGSE